MLIDIIVHFCPNCESINIVKNGHTEYGKQRCLCHDCGKTRVLFAKHKNEKDLEKILKAFKERLSLRGIARIFGVSLSFLLFLIQRFGRSLPNFKKSVLEGTKDDILELDELCSYVGCKKQKRWLWVALSRKTRQVIAYAIGDRSEKTCKKLYNKIPESYKQCASYSDFWKSYENVFSEKTHHSVGKETGQTAHIERWNCRLRQRVSRYVRKNLGFSKTDKFHNLMTKIFIFDYNMNLIKK